MWDSPYNFTDVKSCILTSLFVILFGLSLTCTLFIFSHESQNENIPNNFIFLINISNTYRLLWHDHYLIYDIHQMWHNQLVKRQLSFFFFFFGWEVKRLLCHFVHLVYVFWQELISESCSGLLAIWKLMVIIQSQVSVITYRYSITSQCFYLPLETCMLKHVSFFLLQLF